MLKVLAAQSEQQLATACVQSIVPHTLVIDRWSRERQKPTCALVNQNAAFHLRQSVHLSVRHA